MNNLKELLLKEIPEFREFGHKFINGEVNKMQFKSVSGGFGIYAHRDGKKFMIRLRVSSGVMSVSQLKTIYNLAKKYNLEKIHLTTRQAIQFHGLSIDEVCNVMEEALHMDIFTRGGGGNFPRNVFDVTPYALASERHFIKEIYKYKLPRKLKVSFSSGNDDRAHCTVQDLGFVATKENGKEGFRVFFGGGLGRNPALAIELGEIIDPKDVLYHLEAMLALFINEGNYENKNKARVRYMVEKLGKDGFRNEYKKYLKEAKGQGGLDLKIENINYDKPGVHADLCNKRVYPQKQQGLYSIYVHPIGGQLYLRDLEKLLCALESMETIYLRATMTEGLYILNLNGDEAKRILDLTKDFSAETELEQSVSCIGVPTCQMGILQSQHMLEEIIKYFRENNFTEDILPRIHISGCPNSCGVHQIGKIGLTGKIKRVNDVSINVYELHIGGNFQVCKSALGKVYGDIPENKVCELLLELAKAAKDSGVTFEKWICDEEHKLKEIVNRFAV